MKKCTICKSTKLVKYMNGPFGGVGFYSCFKCRTKDYKKGDRIVGIQWWKGKKECWDYYHLGNPVMPGHTLEDQLAKILKVGKWAQKQGKNVVHFYSWHWDMKSSGSFTFGHENSMEFLREHLEWFRNNVRESLVKDRQADQTTIEEFMEAA